MHTRKRTSKRLRKIGGNNNLQEINVGNIRYESVNVPYTINIGNKKANTLRKVSTIGRHANRNVITSANNPSSHVIQVARSPVSSVASAFSIPYSRLQSTKIGDG